MFHSIKQDRIKFFSNPPLTPIPHVVRDINEVGSPVNKVVLISRDNKSPFAGSHFDPEKHSLRAMLNFGIQLKPVNYDIVDNDLNSMYQTAKRESQSLLDSSSSRIAKVAVASSADPIIDPSKSE